MILREFNKHGIDVTTEDFTGFFVGHVGFFLKIIDVDKVYFRSEEKIPLIPFIYHSKTNYGMRMSGDKGFLQRLIYGENMGTNNPSDYVLDALPRHLFYGKAMDKYLKDGDYQKVIYEDGSYVEVDYSTLKYAVYLNGRVIARNFTSMIPVDETTCLACSRYGGIVVHRLHADGTESKAAYRITDGNLEINAEPEVIYKVSSIQ